jgi:hypothetical protein
MKEIITIKESFKILRVNCNYGWIFQNYLYTPRNAPELYEWGNFLKKFKTLPKNI